MKFRKKPVVVEAIRNDGYWPTVRDWLIGLADGGFAFPVGTAPPITRNCYGSLDIRTPEGTMCADIGDWIIQGVKGEFYPCKPDIFEETYTPEHSAGSSCSPRAEHDPSRRGMVVALLREREQAHREGVAAGLERAAGIADSWGMVKDAPGLSVVGLDIGPAVARSIRAEAKKLREGPAAGVESGRG